MKPRYILPTSTNRSSDCEVRVETVSTPYVVVVKGSAGLVGFVRLMYNDLRDIPVAISIQINIGPSVLVSFFVVLLLVAGLGFVSGPEDENDHEGEDHDCYACNHWHAHDCSSAVLLWLQVVTKDGKMLHVNGITTAHAYGYSIGYNYLVSHVSAYPGNVDALTGTGGTHTTSTSSESSSLNIHQRSGERALLVRPVKDLPGPMR
ncbi:hypothetical protein LENED_002243 [Lentinula edodes]|uniref:Uncharacterized protein n=1 Tax=Lentinula edodes TaxID=5353 RepID=A0A1Q3E115_LENED|nr:hypothetical protein LENED_002243 [Lentinula edodes]